MTFIQWLLSFLLWLDPWVSEPFVWRAKGIVSYGEIAKSRDGSFLRAGDGELSCGSSHRTDDLCLQAYEFLAVEVLGSVLVAVWSPFANLSQPPTRVESFGRVIITFRLPGEVERGR